MSGPAASLEAVLREGHFAVSAEMAPPDSADPEDVLKRVRPLDGWVDAINATDGSGANVHVSSLAVSVLLHRAGYRPVMQVSCRDRNRIAIQGDVLGAAALGLGTILCLTGDGVQAGDHPAAKPVFDLDAITLLGALRGMRDHGRFLSGRALTTPP
ncbi:MAG: methylenetetrahydrofolate reductase, partial [Alphaproteobacteria bacterium]|nr:methylenetetrahydrofolate reductase [Alphaproteobacteria bacterium]